MLPENPLPPRAAGNMLDDGLGEEFDTTATAM